MPAAVVMVAAYAGGAIAGGMVVAGGIATLGIAAGSVLAGVVAGAVVGACIGAVGAAVTGGDVKKGAIMGAVAGGAGGYFSAGWGAGVAGEGAAYKAAVAAPAAEGAVVAAPVAETVAPGTIVTEGGVTADAGVMAGDLGLEAGAAEKGGILAGMSTGEKVMAGGALLYAGSGYLSAKGEGEAAEKETQLAAAQENQRKESMFSAVDVPYATGVTAVPGRRNFSEEFATSIDTGAQLLAQLTIPGVAPTQRGELSVGVA